MTEVVDHLLIGGGVAAESCARALRDAGAEGTVLLVTREGEPPYHRPAASKGYLQARQGLAETHVSPIGWYADAGVELLTETSVMAIDPSAKTARLSTGREVEYRTALLSPGAMVRRLRLEGAQLEGIHYLRTLRNADAIREAASSGPVVCVGGSYVGCEVAASLTELGHACTIAMLEREPMERGFGPSVGRYVRGLLERRGVKVIGGAEVSHFIGDEHVEAVGLKDGQEIPAAAVVCGTGAVPDVMLARRAGLEIGPLGGISTDGELRTEFDGLYVAGDVCEYPCALSGGRARIEHERVAQWQGALAARNMLGAQETYDRVPYFWTDIADWATLEYVGLGLPWDQEIVRGDPESGDCSVVYGLEGRIVGLLAAGGRMDVAGAQRLVEMKSEMAGTSA